MLIRPIDCFNIQNKNDENVLITYGISETIV